MALRALGAILLGLAVFAGAILYPRMMAIAAGVHTTPLVFVLVAAATRTLAGPIIGESDELPVLMSWLEGFGGWEPSHLEGLILYVASTGSLAALIAITVAHQRRLVPGVLGHVVWTGAIMLPLTAFGYLWGITAGG